MKNILELCNTLVTITVCRLFGHVNGSEPTNKDVDCNLYVVILES